MPALLPKSLDAIEKRDAGITVETPAASLPEAALTLEGGTLRDAPEGWKRHRTRDKGRTKGAKKGAVVAVVVDEEDEGGIERYTGNDLS